jgi:phosphoribosylanthranilate isomerase
LRAVQLHDPASDALLDALASRRVKIIRSLSTHSPALTERERAHVVAVIVDGAQPGSGVANDWVTVASLHFEVPMLVAGGLNADNVEDVIRQTHPWGVDVASGVESAHGVKDADRVASFVTRARVALALKEKGPQ